MNNALDTFRTPPYMHNCAQAIAYKHANSYSDPHIVETYAPYKGGKAPEGCCGALYAAMQACPQHAETIKSKFLTICGATHCSELKRIGTPCQKCVITADAILSEIKNIDL